jgi:hypothetical protein
MDQIMGKVGGYWFNQKANKELDDMNVKKSTPSKRFSLIPLHFDRSTVGLSCSPFSSSSSLFIQPA